MNSNAIVKADRELFCFLFNLSKQADCRPILWISKSGDGYLYVALGTLLWLFEREYGALFLYSGLTAYTLEIPIYLLLKSYFKRPRPCDLFTHHTAHITPSDKFSLPSGHTAAAFLMAVMIANFYPSFAALAFIWASLIGLSRIMLGVHYPSDVVIGAILGCCIALTSLIVLG